MKIITDEILHLYVINPELVESELISEIERNIKNSPEFSERLEKIKLFYRKFEKTSNAEPDSNKPPEDPSIITLFPLSTESLDTMAYAKLAANNDAEPKDLYKYVKTFVSARNLVLIRLHHNFAKNKYRLFLISEDMTNVANVKIKIPELKMELTSNSRGIVELDEINIEKVSHIEIEK